MQSAFPTAQTPRIKPSGHSSIASPPAMTPAGNLPSWSCFSSRMISSRLSAFLIMSCSRFRSLSVSLMRESLEPAAALAPFAVAATSKVLDLLPIILRDTVSAHCKPEMSGGTYRCGQSAWRLSRAEQSCCCLSLCVLDLLEVKESYRRTSPYHPVPIMLHPVSHAAFLAWSRDHALRAPSRRLVIAIRRGRPTSFLATGLSASTRCVSLPNCASTSRSASSARLLCASTKLRRFGMARGRPGAMLTILLCASSRVRNRGDSGKFPSCWISLSVRSIAS
jgi:hypothetical protein